MTAVSVVIVIALAWYPVLRLVWWLTWRRGMPVPRDDAQEEWKREHADEWLKAHGITGLRAWWWIHFR